MIEIRRILCPVDFSECSRHAIQHALALARWYGSSLTVLHVVASLPTMDLPGVPLTDVQRDRLVEEMRYFVGTDPA